MMFSIFLLRKWNITGSLQCCTPRYAILQLLDIDINGMLWDSIYSIIINIMIKFNIINLFFLFFFCINIYILMKDQIFSQNKLIEELISQWDDTFTFYIQVLFFHVFVANLDCRTLKDVVIFLQCTVVRCWRQPQSLSGIQTSTTAKTLWPTKLDF